MDALKLEAARKAWPWMRDLDDQSVSKMVDATEESTTAMVEERERWQERYREARRERIANQLLEPGDLSDKEDVVCPHCGAWHQPGAGGASTNVGSFELRCGTCKQMYGVKVVVIYQFTTFKLEANPDG